MQTVGIWRTAQYEWYSILRASRTPDSYATPSAALAHDVPTTLLWPSLQRQTYMHTGRKKANHTPPSIPLHDHHMAWLSPPPPSYEHIAYTAFLLYKALGNFISFFNCLYNPDFSSTQPLYLTFFSPSPLFLMIFFCLYLMDSTKSPGDRAGRRWKGGAFCSVLLV